MDISFSNTDASFSTIDASFSTIDTPFSTIDASFSAIDASFNLIDAPFSTVDASFNIIDAPFINLSIDFVDPDRNDVNVNSKAIIPHMISYFQPDTTDVEFIESNGFKYIEIPYNIHFESTRDEDLVVYERVTEKELSQILM